MVRARSARIAILLVAASAGLLTHLIAVPARIALAAALPALGWTVVILALARPPLAPSLVSVLCGGGVAAPLAWIVNGFLGAPGDVAVLGAPVVEEMTKAFALVALILVLPDEMRDVRHGILYGILVGVGFAAVENASYLTLAAVQGGVRGLLSGLYLRGLVAGLNHAVFTAAVGAGMGWARQGQSRALAPVLGFAAAVGQHVVWNAVASEAITSALCGAVVPGGACTDVPASQALFVTAPMVAFACLGPGALALIAIGRRPRRPDESSTGSVGAGRAGLP
jgi:RsiW-degrading membrane proteinase PrsW (M82 family)